MPNRRASEGREQWIFQPPALPDGLIDDLQRHEDQVRGTAPPAGQPADNGPQPRDTSLGSALRHGVHQVTDKMGLSLKHRGFTKAGEFLEAHVDPPIHNDLTADEALAHNPAIASGAIDAVGLGGLAKPLGAVGRTIADATAKAVSAVAEKAGQTAPGRMLTEAAEHLAPVDKAAATIMRPTMDVAEDLAGSGPVAAVRDARGSVSARHVAERALTGGVESGARSIVDHCASSLGTTSGMAIDPGTVILEPIAGAGLEAGKRATGPGARIATRQLTPEYRKLVGGAAALIAADNAFEKLRSPDGAVAAPSPLSAADMARHATLTRSGHEALSASEPAGGGSEPQDRIAIPAQNWDEIAPDERHSRRKTFDSPLPGDIQRRREE